MMAVRNNRELEHLVALSGLPHPFGRRVAFCLGGRSRRLGFDQQLVDQDRHRIHPRLAPAAAAPPKPLVAVVTAPEPAENAPAMPVPRSAEPPTEKPASPAAPATAEKLVPTPTSTPPEPAKRGVSIPFASAVL